MRNLFEIGVRFRGISLRDVEGHGMLPMPYKGILFP